MELVLKRHKAVQDARKRLILEAAARVFMRSGVERSSMREIAKEAGYTPGAIYSYFPSKQELLGALLADMLERIGQAVSAARAPKGQPERTLIARGQAWLGYLVANPRELELVVFLMSAGLAGSSATSLSLSVHQGLRRCLVPLGESLTALGLSPIQAAQELEAALAYGLGLLLVQDRSQLQGAESSPEFMYGRYLEQLLERHFPNSGGTMQRGADVATPQVDLF